MEGIVFIGIQASGKSSFYKQLFFNTHMRLNLDMLKTRNRERILIDACIRAKQPLVIDNTNPAVADREKYISKLKEGKFKVIGYYFKSTLNDAIIRNELRKGKEKIPQLGILSTYNKLELPSYKEGFDKLYYVSLKNNKYIIEEWNDEI
ncbi:ATP-binding protein [Vallitalea maricola]|uniref:Uncharacterized protein n=1 Tax=Vallitalea maricola TaxID=3074433 RepID=A0ACB5UP02_9FIRM|nr:hypothetical protein AN2V17_39290 [Vallitalea sp. AN17-2]